MNATKYKLNITIECLSKDCFHSLMFKAVEGLLDEIESGELQFDDGDYVGWSVEKENVNF